MVIHATFPDFILFLYVHMSRADDSYDPAELSAIKGKMGALFSEDTDLERKLYSTIREYNSFDKSKLISLFEDTVNHFSETTPEKARILKDLSEIIQADGKIDESEKNALDALKRIIDHHVEAQG